MPLERIVGISPKYSEKISGLFREIDHKFSVKLENGGDYIAIYIRS